MRALLNTAWVMGILYASIPGFWFLVHPFVDYWRARAYSPFRVLLPLWILMWIVLGAVTWNWRLRPLYTTSWAWLAAVPLFLLALSIYARAGREFDARTLVGLTELRSGDHKQALITSGLHARVRHPIYLAHLVSLSAWTLGSGLLVNYTLLFLAIVAGGVMIRLEEREMEQRFGQSFIAYKQRVPAILPLGTSLQ
jgi:protein-S-isoprenylcysteine O-methyltransferase Ste14